MAANPRGSMRANGRSPPFLIIGLCVALVILGFNYWSLSARNGEQANGIAILEGDLRLANAKKISSEKRSEALTDKVADLEKEIGSLKEAFANKVAELNTAKGELEQCRATVSAVEDEKDKIAGQMESCDGEKQALVNKLETMDAEAAPMNKECDQSQCQEFVQLSREQTLKDIYDVAGQSPLVALYKNGGNVGKFADELQKMAEKSHQPIQNAANLPQDNFDTHQQQQQQQQQQDSQQQQQQQQDVINTGQESQNDASKNAEGNKDSGVPQPDKDGNVNNDAVNKIDEAAPNSVQVNEDGKGKAYEEAENKIPAENGDGTNTNADEEVENDNAVDNNDMGTDDDGYDDDDDLDDKLTFHEENQDEDYEYDDEDEDDDYDYNEENKDLEKNDNTIDEMYQQDKWNTNK